MEKSLRNTQITMEESKGGPFNTYLLDKGMVLLDIDDSLKFL